LIAEVGLSEAAVDDLAAKFPPLRGEMWWRRRAGQKVLDVYFLEDTLPELVDMLMGKKLGFSTEQLSAVLAAAPPLLGREVGDVGAVLRFYKEEVSQCNVYTCGSKHICWYRKWRFWIGFTTCHKQLCMRSFTVIFLAYCMSR
jgi:hypothetical protein